MTTKSAQPAFLQHHHIAACLLFYQQPTDNDLTPLAPPVAEAASRGFHYLIWQSALTAVGLDDRDLILLAGFTYT